MPAFNLRAAVLVAAAILGPGHVVRPAAASTTEWDAVKDFSLSSNPNGVWSYSGNHTLFQFTVTEDTCTPGLLSWTNGQDYPNSAAIGRNPTSTTLVSCDGNYDIPPDHLIFGPQSGLVNLFWRAPQAGVYRLTGDFEGLNNKIGVLLQDGVPHFVHIDVLGRYKRLFTGEIVAFEQPMPFDLTLTLREGDTINFTVQPGTWNAYLGTGLAAHITRIGAAQ